jgi:hypothetical protein
MFATIKSLIPEPRQMDQPRRYVGRHRGAETLDLPDVDGPLDPSELTMPVNLESDADDADAVSVDAAPPERAA